MNIFKHSNHLLYADITLVESSTFNSEKNLNITVEGWGEGAQRSIG